MIYTSGVTTAATRVFCIEAITNRESRTVAEPIRLAKPIGKNAGFETVERYRLSTDNLPQDQRPLNERDPIGNGQS
jgi:hypothetical protein